MKGRRVYAIRVLGVSSKRVVCDDVVYLGSMVT